MSPRLFPDELVYSALARICRGFDPTGATHLLRELTGGEHKLARVRLIFPKPLMQSVGFQVERSALSRHTLLPYYCAFLPPQVRERLTKRLASEPEAIFSVAKGDYLSEGLPERLRYCRDCVRYDRASLGSTYWHRAHQLPGCDRCLKHGGMLHVSHVRQVTDGRYSMVTAEAALNLESTHKRCHPVMGAELSERVGRRSATVLTSGFKASLHVSADGYAGKLRSLGFEVNSAVDVQRVSAAFSAFASENRIRLEQLSQGNWWTTMHVKRRVGWHPPVRHLLFQEFLAWFDRPMRGANGHVLGP